MRAFPILILIFALAGIAFLITAGRADQGLKPETGSVKVYSLAEENYLQVPRVEKSEDE